MCVKPLQTNTNVTANHQSQQKVTWKHNIHDKRKLPVGFQRFLPHGYTTNLSEQNLRLIHRPTSITDKMPLVTSIAIQQSQRQSLPTDNDIKCDTCESESRPKHYDHLSSFTSVLKLIDARCTTKSNYGIPRCGWDCGVLSTVCLASSSLRWQSHRPTNRHCGRKLAERAGDQRDRYYNTNLLHVTTKLGGESEM